MAETKKLQRPVEGRVLAGVCAGVAQYLDLDPVLIRVAFVLLGLFAGGGVLAYVILWLIMPEAGADSGAG